METFINTAKLDKALDRFYRHCQEQSQYAEIGWCRGCPYAYDGGNMNNEAICFCNFLKDTQPDIGDVYEEEKNG